MNNNTKHKLTLNFNGSIDELLNHVSNVSDEEIERISDDNRMLDREESIALVMEEAKLPREEAEKIVTEFQLEELDIILKGMVEKGLIEISEYDKEGNPLYTATEKGKKYLK